MKKLLFIVFALFLQTGSFEQDNLVWNCDRDSQQPDILGSSNDTHAQGWVAWPLTSDEFTGPLLNQAKWEVAGDQGYTCHGMSPYAYFKNNLNNVKITNNRLVLKVEDEAEDPFFCLEQLHNYSSGWIGSQTKFHYGLIQIKCKIPSEISLEPSFWTVGEVYYDRYDEIDVFEKIPEEYSNKIFRQNLLKKSKSTMDDTIIERECKKLIYPTTYAGVDFIITLEWLPTELNFYVNGHWTNGYKYSTDPTWISDEDFNPPLPRSIFTCVDFTYACEQQIELSLSLVSPSPWNINQGFEVDWIRSFKLIKSTILDYWPSDILIIDPELSRVHSTVKFGGTKNAIVPINSNITIWASNTITLDKGFTLSPGIPFELRRIDTDQALFYSNSNEEETK